ncbi:MAG TPA: cyclase family protein [Vicinamibacterales bacterium]|jgi:kynurenine formamidase|nr:cyclase family protein [Vicinamibacterales bacterium]
MRARLATGLLVALTLGAALAAQGRGGGAPLLGPGPSAARTPKNTAEFDVMFNQVKNWGRWGANDELGAANLITEAKRKQAIALAKQGIVVGLAHPPLEDAAPDNTSPFEHTVNRGLTTDTYKVSYHGYAHSHIDALCHFAYKGQTYNGYQASDVNTEKGCTKLSIEALKNGVVTRGILLDIPRLKGVPWLEPGTPVFVEDIEAWEKKAGVKVGPGDAIFLRTGRWARRAKLGPWAVGQNEAGYHASVAPWLKERGVAFLASDDAQDVTPSLVEGITLPVHTLAIAGMGIDILDNQDLEAVAETAAKLNRWEFLMTVGPVPVIGGTGFPVNALAIF